MFGGFGSINHMIVTLRNNRNLLPIKQSYFKKKNYATIKNEYYDVAEGEFELKKATPEQLKFVRETIIKRRKKESLRLTITLCIALSLICFGIYKAFDNFSFGFPQTKAAIETPIESSTEEKYMFYLEDGDKWLQKRNYYNAVFQYKKALQLYPSDFDANYRLALGYSYQCQYDFENCETGMQLILKLEKEFPENKDIKDVKAIFVHWGE